MNAPKNNLTDTKLADASRRLGRARKFARIAGVLGTCVVWLLVMYGMQAPITSASVFVTLFTLLFALRVGGKWVAGRLDGRVYEYVRKSDGRSELAFHIEAALASDRATSYLAQRKLEHVLPLVGREELEALSRGHLRLLEQVFLRSLKKGNILLALRILALFEQTGDPKTILVTIEKAGAGRHGPEISRAARRCAAIVRDRAARDALTDSLLRPAEPVEVSTLLRPSAGMGVTPSEQLLRIPDDQPA